MVANFDDSYRDENALEGIEAWCDANFYGGTAKRMLEDPTPICKVARENANNVGCYLLINTDYPASPGGEASQPKQICLRSSTYDAGLGHGPLLEATETIGDAAISDKRREGKTRT